MNSRPTSEEAPSTRHSTRSRYSIPTYDASLTDTSRVSTSKSTLKSKSGINGRDYEDEDLLTTSVDRSVRRNRSGDRSTKNSLDELEQDIALARSSSNVSNKGRDHPWKSPSSSGDAIDINSSSPGNNTFATNDRWVPDSDYAIQSREATSNAVVEMATKFADIQADRFDDASFAPMGGVRGSGELQDDKEYVKGRLSSLLLSPEGRDSTNQRREAGSRLVHSAPAKSEESDYDRVRNQAMKMLRIADSLDSNSGSSASPTRGADNKVTGLFRTATGGLSMRQLEDDEVSFLKKKRTNASLAGIERYGKESVPRVNSIKSGDEDDLPYSQHSANDEYADEETPNTSRSSSWSSRYSVERQLMAITGGLDSTRILNKMDNLNMSRQKTKSARGMYRSSAAAMDGSGEEYGDYTKTYSTTGGGIGGVWNYIRGTLWSDLTEMNYDGTTQSLVRREKRKVKRRRIMMGLVGLVALCITIGVLVVKGNPKPSFARSTAQGAETVNFYVLSDEPYDLSNIRQLTRELENLPSDAEFLIHLGNANGDSQSRCQEYGYERAASILKESPVPTFVIPGDRDWVRCSKPTRALEWWSQNLGMFDTKFEESKKFNVAHQQGGEENFAFLHKGVLFLSVHIVDTETNASEWTSRHERNVMWTKEQLNKDGYRSVVIFGHAPPSSKQGEYFWPIIDQLKDTNIPVLYLHANTEGGEFEEYHPYGEAENFEAVQLEKKGVEAPMRVTVWGGKRKQNNMFEFTRRNHDGSPAGYEADS
jgi:hypothetical protein